MARGGEGQPQGGALEVGRTVLRVPVPYAQVDSVLIPLLQDFSAILVRVNASHRQSVVRSAQSTTVTAYHDMRAHDTAGLASVQVWETVTLEPSGRGSRITIVDSLTPAALGRFDRVTNSAGHRLTADMLTSILSTRFRVHVVRARSPRGPERSL